MIIDSTKAEEEVVVEVAKLMAVAARTAPKARGEDKIQTAILTGEDKARLVKLMEERRSTRDAAGVRDAGAVVLIGVELGDPNGEWIAFKAKLIDLGIAVGSAAKLASDFNVDNRVMRSVGAAAEKMGILKANEIEGIPLSIKGKNIFFDRKT